MTTAGFCAAEFRILAAKEICRLGHWLGIDWGGMKRNQTKRQNRKF
jgi:hypothetical protein